MPYLLTLALLVTAAAAVHAAPCPHGTLTGQVTFVRDGDTIVVGSMPIRLNGLAAPEWDEPGGDAAMDAMLELVEVGPCGASSTASARTIAASASATSRAWTSQPRWSPPGGTRLPAVQRWPLSRDRGASRGGRRDDRADVPATGILPTLRRHG